MNKTVAIANAKRAVKSMFPDAKEVDFLLKFDRMWRDDPIIEGVYRVVFISGGVRYTVSIDTNTQKVQYQYVMPTKEAAKANKRFDKVFDAIYYEIGYYTRMEIESSSFLFAYAYDCFKAKDAPSLYNSRETYVVRPKPLEIELSYTFDFFVYLLKECLLPEEATKMLYKRMAITPASVMKDKKKFIEYLYKQADQHKRYKRDEEERPWDDDTGFYPD